MLEKMRESLVTLTKNCFYLITQAAHFFKQDC